MSVRSRVRTSPRSRARPTARSRSDGGGPPARRSASARSRSRFRICCGCGAAWRSAMANSYFSAPSTPASHRLSKEVLLCFSTCCGSQPSFLTDAQPHATPPVLAPARRADRSDDRTTIRSWSPQPVRGGGEGLCHDPRRARDHLPVSVHNQSHAIAADCDPGAFRRAHARGVTAAFATADDGRCLGLPQRMCAIVFSLQSTPVTHSSPNQIAMVCDIERLAIWWNENFPKRVPPNHESLLVITIQ